MRANLLYLFLIQLAAIIGSTLGKSLPLPKYIEKLNEPSDKLCTLSTLRPSFMQKISSKLTRYSGFKFYKLLRVNGYPISFTSEILTVLCSDGQVIYNYTLPLNKGENENSVWGKVVPVSNATNLLIERSSGFGNAFLTPGVVVGRLSRQTNMKTFVQNSNNVSHSSNTTSANTSLPLQTINYETGWYKFKRVKGLLRWKYEKYIPLLETPNGKKFDNVLATMVDMTALKEGVSQHRRRTRMQSVERGKKTIAPPLTKLKHLAQGYLTQKKDGRPVEGTRE